MPSGLKYPKELIERGVRLALESGRPIRHVAADLGMHPETLRKHMICLQRSSGNDKPRLCGTSDDERSSRLG